MKNKFSLICASSLMILLLVVGLYVNYILKDYNIISVNTNDYLDVNVDFDLVGKDNKIIKVNDYECSFELDVNEDGMITRSDTSYLEDVMFGKNSSGNDLKYDYDKDQILSSNDILVFDSCIIKEYFKINHENIGYSRYSHLLNNEYLNFIHGIPSDIKVSEFKEMIETDKDLSVFNEDDEIILDTEYVKTGYKLMIEDLDFTLIVAGDVLKTGILDVSAAKRIASYVVDSKMCLYYAGENSGSRCLDGYYPDVVLPLEEQIKKSRSNYMFNGAADYNGDGIIKMNDVMKMLKDIKNKQE